ncbi:hypothetical protein ASPFODRAFT_484868 [Aspergillus luchuensis CBS 106.47]|uniref:Uncharacterized protein n=1 Tax=Aspergillus luchuensis (strain CBS 106.47) TaxID=1137211 RepID=A0A1M3TRP6_ASPLC|nr:hypothetical protein ASPFODRAFT_484868 [Aspergillus luchuensis CBS 106.47]
MILSMPFNISDTTFPSDLSPILRANSMDDDPWLEIYDNVGYYYLSLRRTRVTYCFPTTMTLIILSWHELLSPSPILYTISRTILQRSMQLDTTPRQQRSQLLRKACIGNNILSSLVIGFGMWVCMTSPLMINLSKTQPPSALLS